MKQPKDFTVDEVCIWLAAIGLGAKAPDFRNQQVDGGLLVMFGTAEFADLGVSAVDAMKIQRALAFANELAGSKNDVNEDRVKELEEENARLKREVDILKHQLDGISKPASAPAPAPAPAPRAPPPAKKEHHVIKGAAGGAVKGVVIGAVAGAVAGDARRGAKIGAATGAAAGGMQGLGARRRARLVGR